MRVKELVRAMLPQGSFGDGQGWNDCPAWPPDVFAVAATLVDRSSAYTRLYTDFAVLLKPARVAERKKLAAAWKSNDWLKPETYVDERAALQVLWNSLSDCDELVYRLQGTDTNFIESNTADEQRNGASSDQCRELWVEAALSLMIIADEACAGLGFGFDHLETANWIQRSYLARAVERARHDQQVGAMVQQMPYTACECIADSVACVQPKTRTPSVGCTLRSMTHHLALLPPAGVVRAHWNYVDTQFSGSHSFNVLIIPIPYAIPGNAFHRVSSTASKRDRDAMFGIRQTWLGDNVDEVADFVITLIKKAQSEVERIDGIVLPELALNPRCYAEIACRMCNDEDINAQFLIAGVLVTDTKTVAGTKTRAGGRVATADRSGNRPFTNAAITTVFDKSGSEIALMSMQKKHHRWKLDGHQIAMYSLGNALNPEKDWWENARISDREMSFYTFRSGACFTTLVCEDLARADPGQQVIRAIGPNVVFALLMDGPQLSARWPGRYAMGLTDDPGSSVLSLSSAGLIQRSNHHFSSSANEIALWRDPSGTARSLKLASGEHGLILNLTQRRRKEMTLDRRGDGSSAFHWLLSGCIPVRSNQAVPEPRHTAEE